VAGEGGRKGQGRKQRNTHAAFEILQNEHLETYF
jgi:hypothetical protein